MKNRDTVEAIVGAVTGSPDRPENLIVGRCRGKELEVVGRTVPLKPAQAAVVGPLRTKAITRHPWPDQISSHWGRGSKTPILKVRLPVVEVAADAAM
ncbi:hypothetical protein OG394_29680 [Kribbella sp. NBC_01245]|uniref:hypothetical protein n=1 Tax=Kribbella sp. NBC_01245 TaxID=2903578 RepID=UPI002E27FC56|nr:hypothetical protein [Kribbella sp. NBC_01245]